MGELVGTAEADLPAAMPEMEGFGDHEGQHFVGIRDRLRFFFNALTTIRSKTRALLGAGVRKRSATRSVTGSDLAVATGLTTVTSVIATVKVAATTNAAYATAVPSATAGKIDIYVWKTDGTAATAPVNVTWSAYGT